MKLIFVIALIGATQEPPPLWELHPKMVCRETFTLRCKVGDFTDCERGELTTPIVTIDFAKGVVRDRFLADGESEIANKLYRKATVGHYAETIVVTTDGKMITIYPETSGAPGNYHGLRQHGFLRRSNNSFLTCIPDD